MNYSSIDVKPLSGALGVEVFGVDLSIPLDNAARAEFTCRFRWRRDSLALWDNRVGMHNAVADFFGEVDAHRRVMHRATIGGDRPTLG